MNVKVVVFKEVAELVVVVVVMVYVADVVGVVEEKKIKSEDKPPTF